MDIQRMVDERIRELRNQTIRISRPGSSSPKSERRYDLPGLEAESPTIRSENPRSVCSRRFDDRFVDSRDELSSLAAMMDSSLTEVAERILSITDRVAGDYMRLEKDILDSRLALLQSAESVLDIAITLRRKAKAIIAAAVRTEASEPPAAGSNVRRNYVRPMPDDDFIIADEERYHHIQEGRVSMHDQGVASLFRRT